MDDRVQRVHEQIDRDRFRRHSNRVLHGHPSPTLWDEPDVPVAPARSTGPGSSDARRGVPAFRTSDGPPAPLSLLSSLGVVRHRGMTQCGGQQMGSKGNKGLRLTP